MHERLVGAYGPIQDALPDALPDTGRMPRTAREIELWRRLCQEAERGFASVTGQLLRLQRGQFAISLRTIAAWPGMSIGFAQRALDRFLQCGWLRRSFRGRQAVFTLTSSQDGASTGAGTDRGGASDGALRTSGGESKSNRTRIENDSPAATATLPAGLSDEDRLFAMRAAIMLALTAFAGTPRGSLPNDDPVLSHIAGLIDDPAAWARLRTAITADFALGPDGRLWHRLWRERVASAGQSCAESPSESPIDSATDSRERESPMNRSLNRLGETGESVADTAGFAKARKASAPEAASESICESNRDSNRFAIPPSSSFPPDPLNNYSPDTHKNTGVAGATRSPLADSPWSFEAPPDAYRAEAIKLGVIEIEHAWQDFIDRGREMAWHSNDYMATWRRWLRKFIAAGSNGGSNPRGSNSGGRQPVSARIVPIVGNPFSAPADDGAFIDGAAYG